MAETGTESIRCFVGLPLPSRWQESLDRVAGRLAARLASRVSWTRPGNWHITLKFLGQVEQARLPELLAALDQVVFAPFGLGLSGGGNFPAAGQSPRALWIGLAQGAQECAHLAALVERALAHCGVAAAGRAFRPHVTLGRVKAAAAGDDWSALSRELVGETFAAARVEGFVLWRSVLGPGGPKYAALKIFPARDHGGCPAGGAA